MVAVVVMVVMVLVFFVVVIVMLVLLVRMVVAVTMVMVDFIWKCSVFAVISKYSGTSAFFASEPKLHFRPGIA